MRGDYSKLIFEISKEGRTSYSLPGFDGESIEEMIDASLVRDEKPRLPEVSERDIVMHYTKLSEKNYGVDSGLYPLGSCTMKYNPKVCEDIAALEGFSAMHPYQSELTAQGSLMLMHSLAEALCEITGMAAFSLQPAAGAHGELAGLMMAKKRFETIGQANRTKIIVPDSSHGTNPASAAIAGFDVISIDSGPDGLIDLDALQAAVGSDTAALMVTNPNTLGLFEKGIAEACEIVHKAGGLVYYDGANLNAIMGIAKPADMGVDIMHVNVHKTFAAPHGGGGPGAGPIGASEEMAAYLPGPNAAFKEGSYILQSPAMSIGQVRGYYSSLSVLVKAYAYIAILGGDGLSEASIAACLNANYLREKLSSAYKMPHSGPCMHEFAAAGLLEAAEGVHTDDVAKRLIDYGYHPPTVYFPLIVEEAIMVEPTETESIESLDDFAEAMLSIAKEAVESPSLLKSAPGKAPAKRIDSLLAAKKPVLTYWQLKGENNG